MAANDIHRVAHIAVKAHTIGTRHRLGRAGRAMGQCLARHNEGCQTLNCTFLTLRHLKFGRAVRCHQSGGMPAWHPDQILNYARLAVVPVIWIIRLVW